MANKMSFEQFEGYVLGKFPEAMTWVKDNKVCIAFYGVGSKAYEYSKINYVSVLNKIGYTVSYESEIKHIRAEIERLETELSNGGYSDDIFGENDFTGYTEQQLNNIKHSIECYKNRLNDKNLIII